MVSNISRLAALIDEVTGSQKDRKALQEVYERKAAALQLAAELALLEARVPVLKAALTQSIEALEKSLRSISSTPEATAAQPARTGAAARTAPASTGKEGNKK